MLIGILEAERMPDSLNAYGSFADLFAELLNAQEQAYEFKRYLVIDGHFPSGILSCDGYLITGSTHAAYEDLPWINRLKEFAVEISQSGRPLVGVCFGHQLIAEALGGKVEKFNGGWGVGRHRYHFHNTELGPDCEQDSLVINAFHQDQVTELPIGAQVFASSEFCQYAGVVYGNNTLTLQAHPEFSIAFETDLTADNASDIVPQHIRDAALADLTSGTAYVDNQIISRMMINLFNAHRKPKANN